MGVHPFGFGSELPPPFVHLFGGVSFWPFGLGRLASPLVLLSSLTALGLKGKSFIEGVPSVEPSLQSGSQEVRTFPWSGLRFTE